MNHETPLSTIKQCRSCPWKIGCVPDRDIPNGYRVDLHASLISTIRSGLDSLRLDPLRIMACHYSKIGAEFPCAGWLHNQLGSGNHLGARLAVMLGRLPVPEVDGDQHEIFEDTLPKSSRRAPRIHWKRADDGFVESRCGRWWITPLYCGCTRPQAYELQRDGKIVDSYCQTQREAKARAEELAREEPS